MGLIDIIVFNDRQKSVEEVLAAFDRAITACPSSDSPLRWRRSGLNGFWLVPREERSAIRRAGRGRGASPLRRRRIGRTRLCRLAALAPQYPIIPRASPRSYYLGLLGRAASLPR
jgi:hypothetical protein